MLGVLTQTRLFLAGLQIGDPLRNKDIKRGYSGASRGPPTWPNSPLVNSVIIAGFQLECDNLDGVSVHATYAQHIGAGFNK